MSDKPEKTAEDILFQYTADDWDFDPKAIIVAMEEYAALRYQSPVVEKDLDDIYFKANEIGQSDFQHIRHFYEWMNERYTITKKQ